MRRVRIICLITAIALMCVFTSGCGENADIRDMTTMELVQDMGLGINLGNTLEATGGETSWGSPVITKEMIQGYKDSGFGVLRVPAAWSYKMTGNYDIDPEFLARVTQIVDWALESDLYVILNIHWDGGWFSRFANEADRDECFYKYERIRTQLTKHFKKYDDRLMFESLNEEGGWNDIWNQYSGEGDKELSYSILNDINRRFVNIVRDSGGNNAGRHLLIAGYNTGIELTSDELYKMPADPAGRCAVSVHYYTPSTFAILEKDADWGKARYDWGTKADLEELEQNIEMMKTNFVDKGIPVIFGEYGCPTKNKDEESVRLYLSNVCEAVYTNGMCPVLWDISDAFYNRREAEFIDPELLESLMSVKELER